MAGSSQMKPTEGAERIHSACELASVSFGGVSSSFRRAIGLTTTHSIRSAVEEPHQSFEAIAFAFKSLDEKAVTPVAASVELRRVSFRSCEAGLQLTWWWCSARATTTRFVNPHLSRAASLHSRNWERFFSSAT